MNPASAMGALSAKGWRGSALLVALGALGGLGHPPFSWPLVTIAAFAAGCFALVNCGKQIDAVKVGWLFGAGYFAVSLIWIVEPFMVFPERDGWMAPFAIFFAAAGLGGFWGAGFWAAWKLGIGPGSRALALAGCIAAIGMLREELLTGFPWALPSYVWSDAPVAQALAVVGPHGLTFLTALAAFSPFLARKPWVGATIAAAGISVIWAAVPKGRKRHRNTKSESSKLSSPLPKARTTHAAPRSGAARARPTPPNSARSAPAPVPRKRRYVCHRGGNFGPVAPESPVSH